MNFTADIPTKLFRIEGFKGFKFSVDKKPQEMVGGTMAFEACGYTEGSNYKYYRATGQNREMALSNLLTKMTIVKVVSKGVTI